MKEQVLDILKDGINDIEQVKKQYPKMHTQDVLDALKRLQDRINELTIPVVVNCVYVVTERDNYGEQLFKGVFANKEKAIEYLTEDGLTESNIDEINEIELD